MKVVDRVENPADRSKKCKRTSTYCTTEDLTGLKIIEI